MHGDYGQGISWLQCQGTRRWEKVAESRYNAGRGHKDRTTGLSAACYVARRGSGALANAPGRPGGGPALVLTSTIGAHRLCLGSSDQAPEVAVGHARLRILPADGAVGSKAEACCENSRTRAMFFLLSSCSGGTEASPRAWPSARRRVIRAGCAYCGGRASDKAARQQICGSHVVHRLAAAHWPRGTQQLGRPRRRGNAGRLEPSGNGNGRLTRRAGRRHRVSQAMWRPLFGRLASSCAPLSGPCHGTHGQSPGRWLVTVTTEPSSGSGAVPSWPLARGWAWLSFRAVRLRHPGVRLSGSRRTRTRSWRTCIEPRAEQRARGQLWPRHTWPSRKDYRPLG